MGGFYQPAGKIARAYKVFFILLCALMLRLMRGLFLAEFILNELRQSGDGFIRILPVAR